MKSGAGNNYSDLIGSSSRFHRSKYVRSSARTIHGSNNSLSNGLNRKNRLGYFILIILNWKSPIYF